MLYDLKDNTYVMSLAGMAALCIGIGIARFAYTPLLANLITTHWLDQSQAIYLAAINLAGYLLGAILSQKLSNLPKQTSIIKLAVLITIISLFACGLNFGYAWLMLWRLIAGMTGAILMILTPSLIFRHISPTKKGRASGIIFSGVGIGIVISGIGVPALLKFGIAFTWIALAIIAVMMMVIILIALPSDTYIKHSKMTKINPKTKPIITMPLILLMIAYMANAIGFVPHNLYLVVFLKSQLNDSQILSTFVWTIFGVGAVIGTLVSGFLIDLFTAQRCLVHAFILSLVGMGLLLVTQNIVILLTSTFLMGVMFMSMVAISASYLHELVSSEDYAKFWSIMTIIYALSQAIIAYVMSYLTNLTHSFIPDFQLAGIVLAFGLIITIYLGKRNQYSSNGTR